MFARLIRTVARFRSAARRRALRAPYRLELAELEERVLYSAVPAPIDPLVPPPIPELIPGDWQPLPAPGADTASGAAPPGDTAGLLVEMPASLPLSGEFRVNAATAGRQVSGWNAHNIALDRDGNSVVVWSSQAADGGWDVFARRYDASGTPQGAEFLVSSDPTGQQLGPAVAMAADGSFLVAWTDTGPAGTDTDVYARRFAADGVPAGDVFLVNTYRDGRQLLGDVATAPDGRAVITWVSDGQDGEGAGIYGQRYDARGGVQGSEFRVNSFTAQQQSNPSVAMDADGNFVVVWDSVGQDGSAGGVYAQRFDAAGRARGGEFPVNAWTPDHQGRPSVAMDARGNFVIAWESFQQDGDASGIFARPYAATGDAIADAFRVNTRTADNQWGPAVACTSNGEFVIAWTSAAEDGPSAGIFARRYAFSGQPLGSEFLVNETTSGDQQGVALAVDATGKWTFLWSGAGVGDSQGVFARRWQSLPLTTGEDGRTATFTVALATRPTADVTIHIGSSGPLEIVPAVSSLIFTDANWNIPQTVTLVGVNDWRADGAVSVQIGLKVTSPDAAYSERAALSLHAVNLDDEHVTPPPAELTDGLRRWLDAASRTAADGGSNGDAASTAERGSGTAAGSHAGLGIGSAQPPDQHAAEPSSQEPSVRARRVPEPAVSVAATWSSGEGSSGRVEAGASRVASLVTPVSTSLHAGPMPDGPATRLVAAPSGAGSTSPRLAMVPAAVTVPSPWTVADVDLSLLWQQFDTLLQDWTRDERWVTGTIAGLTITTLALSSVYLIWTSRARYLAATVLASHPAWNSLDLLPVLDDAAGHRRRDRAPGPVRKKRTSLLSPQD